MITLDKIARYKVFGDEREEFCKYFLKVLKSKDDNDKENLIRKISKESTIESYEIINSLLLCCSDNKDVLKEIRDYYYGNKIKGHSCLVISDSHIGRLDLDENDKNIPLKNEKTLLDAYEFAYKKGIKYAIHAGDLIEGDSNPNQRRIWLEEQIDNLKDIYSQINDIKTYILLGNHDLNAIRFGPTTAEDMERMKKGNGPYSNIYVYQTMLELKNTELIGVEKAFVDFEDSLIMVHHPFDSGKKTFNKLERELNLELVGHHHRFSVDKENNRVILPSTMNVTNNKEEIGFIELVDEEYEFVVKKYNRDLKLTREESITKNYVIKYN